MALPAQLTGRRLIRIDCTEELPPERYFGHGAVAVVSGPAGRYRQAEGVPLSRFGYRFEIDHVDRPHLAIIRYPDDAQRFMTVMDGTGYDLSTGVLTGGAWPLSGGLLTLNQVFWPRWRDCSLVFATWSDGEPAAVADIEVYELDSLPPLPLERAAGDRSRRELGVQYEDPCGTGASEGALDKETWVDRVATYMRHTGQQLLVYPLVWYHGPQYPAAREPADAFDVVVARDRRQYCRWTTRPPEWVQPLLARFERDGLRFRGALTLLRLGSLMQQMNTDLEAIRGGADTINNMVWCDQVQGGTADWTTVYNARNYPALLQYYAEGRDLGDFPWAYGERGGPSPHPIFNPLHPVVERAILDLVGDIAERYGHAPAFTGLSLNLWHATMVWFASLRCGYDDYTVNAFSRETGILVPVEAGAPDRFSRRFQYLTSICRPAWIDWRCRRITALLGRVRDRLQAVRSDLTLTLTLWDETTVPQLYGWASVATQLGARPSTVDLYREGGVDVARLAAEPGIELDLGLGNTRDRGGHPPDSTRGLEATLSSTAQYRDHDFLDQATLDAVGRQPRPGAFVFNCWVEAWGDHRWFPCADDDAQAAALAIMSGQPAEGVFRLNSTYPPDGFWWDSQLRITPPFPAGPHFLEPYVHALAEMDVCRLTRGGLFLDKAHGEWLRPFAAAYCRLPRQRLQTVGDRTDPVAVRQGVDGDRRVLYAVNREPYAVDLQVQFERAPTWCTDLATGAAVAVTDTWATRLGPYELRCLAVPPDAPVAGFTATAPTAVTRALAAQVQTVLAALERAGADGLVIPGAAALQAQLAPALAAGRLAWLRHAVHSYAARRALEGTRTAAGQP